MGNFKIREFRKAKGVFQEEMAAVIGLTQSNLSRYENNAIDLTNEMIDKLREKYGREEVDAYLTDTAEQIRDKDIPSDRKDEMTTLDLITIVKKQNETICQQIEAQNTFARQLSNMNERLLNLLEKIQFD